MMKLDVLRLLEMKGLTKYWLWKEMNMAYHNFDRMIKNETQSIRYDNLEKLCNALDCTPNDLFVVEPDEIVELRKERG